MIDLLWCDGTWSRPGARSPVSEALRQRIDGARVRFRYVDFPAAYGPATGLWDMSIGESIDNGHEAVVAEVGRLVSASPSSDIVLGGYSQGAMAALLASNDYAVRSQRAVKAFAALGNPHQSVHVGRAGIAGPQASALQTISIYAPGDPIADLPLGSPLRTIADLTEWMSLRSPEEALLWWGKVLQKAIDAKFQAWWQPWRWRDVNDALAAVNRYLGTAHTLDYIPDCVERLARQIEALA